jgi:hypothetical protein
VRILDERDTDPPGAEAAVAGVFEARYPELVRLAGLLGADDPEDIAQEAFARLLRRYGSLRDADAALGYVRVTVCNLVRSRRRHLRVARLRTPVERQADVESSVARRIFVLNQTQSVSGVAVRSVTSVTAVLADGKQYPGTIITNKLFTYPVWIVSYPLKDPATLVFRNAAGKEVAVLHEPANP